MMFTVDGWVFSPHLKLVVLFRHGFHIMHFLQLWSYFVLCFHFCYLSVQPFWSPLLGVCPMHSVFVIMHLKLGTILFWSAILFIEYCGLFHNFCSLLSQFVLATCGVSNWPSYLGHFLVSQFFKFFQIACLYLYHGDCVASSISLPVFLSFFTTSIRK